MNVLYITTYFPNELHGKNLYNDLAEELNRKHKVFVVAGTEKKYINKTELVKERGINVLRVKIGNIYEVNIIKKAISIILLQFQLKHSINSMLKNERFDMILFMAPPVTFTKVVKFAMKKYNAKSYLMQKDIFPQNAIDLRIMSRLNPVYWYFRIKEKNLYKTASKIGCMSQGNIDYLKKNNKFLSEQKLELFPNTIKTSQTNKNINNEEIRKKYNIPKESVIALYGGNFGKPQGIDFIIRVLDNYKNRKDVFFIFSGKGTEKDKLFKYINKSNFDNIITLDYIPKQEYDKILQETDIGLIFLDYRFTIPNIPSRTLSYYEYSIPIMAATDKNTDYKQIIEDTKSGMWAYSNDINEFKEKFDYLIKNKLAREEMGKNGRNYLENNLTTEKSVKILEEAYKKIKKEGKKNV